MLNKPIGQNWHQGWRGGGGGGVVIPADRDKFNWRVAATIMNFFMISVNFLIFDGLSDLKNGLHFFRIPV